MTAFDPGSTMPLNFGGEEVALTIEVNVAGGRDAALRASGADGGRSGVVIARGIEVVAGVSARREARRGMRIPPPYVANAPSGPATRMEGW